SNQRHGGGGPTVVVSVSLLLAGLESAVADVAGAVLEMTDPPPAVTFRTIVTVTDPPGPRSPGRDIVTGFGPLQVPRLETQETNVGAAAGATVKRGLSPGPGS